LTARVESRTLTDSVNPRHFSHVVGVDLGGGKGKKTALATLRVDGAAATVVEIAPRDGARPFYDATLIQTIRQFGDGTLLCLDAPLTLPPCLRCTVPVCPGQEACVDPAVVAMRAIIQNRLETGSPAERDFLAGRDGRRGKPPVTPYTQRATEVYLTHRLGLAPREALGQGTGPLAARAAHLARALADRFTLNETLLEVYPKGTLAALGFQRPYKKHMNERETRAQILESLAGDLRFGPGVWRERCVQSDHLFEAVICAYTGFLWARDGWTAPDLHASLAAGGWIWTPPPREAAQLAATAEG
jgi:hypothetical protein